MLARINTLRAGVGAQPVALCQALHHSAVAHATDMATNRFFDHKGSDGSTLAVRVDRTTYGRWTYLAENIAAGQRSVEQVMNGWINSPGHYANLTSTNVTHVGLGFIQSSGSPYGTYWVQNFGTSGTC